MDDPLDLITADQQQATIFGDPLAEVCYLATVDDGAAAVRTMTIRSVGRDGIGLLMSANSPKWRQLAAGSCEILLHYPSLPAQYRVRGTMAPMPQDKIDELWAARARGGQLVDWLYMHLHQSLPVASEAELDKQLDELERRLPTPAPQPPALRGIMIVPDRIERWQGSPENRRHDRWLYEREDEAWTATRLVP